jgi:hypothetical protein
VFIYLSLQYVAAADSSHTGWIATLRAMRRQICGGTTAISNILQHVEQTEIVTQQSNYSAMSVARSPRFSIGDESTVSVTALSPTPSSNVQTSIANDDAVVVSSLSSNQQQQHYYQVTPTTHSTPATVDKMISSHNYRAPSSPIRSNFRNERSPSIDSSSQFNITGGDNYNDSSVFATPPSYPVVPPSPIVPLPTTSATAAQVSHSKHNHNHQQVIKQTKNSVEKLPNRLPATSKPPPGLGSWFASKIRPLIPTPNEMKLPDDRNPEVILVSSAYLIEYQSLIHKVLLRFCRFVGTNRESVGTTAAVSKKKNMPNHRQYLPNRCRLARYRAAD